VDDQTEATSSVFLLLVSGLGAHASRSTAPQLNTRDQPA
jgi:hypothetical protein